ncbi:MAG: hypothetical protein ABH824_00770 [Nanoarchaeota archaeon]|nr:hypothetical protein [Nanoarchaeota archaeon]MBU1632175.1 hypothetical protein [Nanoarchaeota archaeon]MBU1875496.1 hypothetical protein [Nanoarchaeota archaeon]
METRKIVKSGNTSYILALPIKWIRINNLDSGKLVQVSENDQGDLIISAEKRKLISKEDFVTIKVDGKDYETINLEFLTAYIRDATSIIFEGTEIVPKSNNILKNISFFIGLDVIEQSTKSIVVKNFFSLDKETSPHILLKKMDIVNRASFELLQDFFRKSFANEDFFELQKLNEQNERLFALIRKSILKLFENPKLMRDIQTNYLQISKEKIFAQSFMNISLNLLSLGNAFLFLDRTRNEAKILENYFSIISDDYQNILNAVNNKLYPNIHSFLKGHPFRLEEIDKFLKMLEEPPLIQAIYILHSIYNNLKIIANEALT